MVSQNVTKLLQQTKSLSPQEREQFLQLLRSQGSESRPVSTTPATEPAGRGVMITVPPKLTPEKLAELKAREPIELPGGPLSDDIVRDRR